MLLYRKYTGIIQYICTMLYIPALHSRMDPSQEDTVHIHILRRDYGSSTVRIQKIYLREDGSSAERIQYLLHRRCSIDFKERMGPPQGGFVFKEKTCPSPKRGCVVQGGESFAQNFTTLQRTEGQSGQSPHKREDKKRSNPWFCLRTSDQLFFICRLLQRDYKKEPECLTIVRG
jgi:hypothetical protein